MASLLVAFACFSFDSLREEEKGLSFSIWFIAPEAKLILWQHIILATHAAGAQISGSQLPNNIVYPTRFDEL